MAADSKGRTIRVGAIVALAASVTQDSQRMTRGNGTPIPAALYKPNAYHGGQAIVKGIINEGLDYECQPKAPERGKDRVKQDAEGNDVIGPDGQPVIVHRTLDQANGWPDGCAKVRVEIEEEAAGVVHHLWCRAEEVTVVGQSAPKV